jgi:hypothetical protein
MLTGTKVQILTREEVLKGVAVGDEVLHSDM